MRIYVAGGSSEVNIVAEYMDRLRHMGHVITHDWTVSVKEYGGNPRDATDGQRLAWSTEDIRGIESCDIMWCIMPRNTSFGCAFECGFACGIRKHWIISGNWRRSIFSAFSVARVDDHEDALHGIGLYQTGVDNVLRKG